MISRLFISRPVLATVCSLIIMLAGAVAIGPVLQGLNAPVNDLSRGATVRDIINTVAITGIQAKG